LEEAVSFLQELNNIESGLMQINILITSVSRKVWLVKAFKDALARKGIEGKVIAVDSNPLSAGLYISDGQYLTPLSSEQGFVDSILKICRKENVKLLIPTRDDELLLFAQNRQSLEKQGIRVMVSSPNVIEICRDKYKFYQFLKQVNMPTPATYVPGEVDLKTLNAYPFLIKSRYGAGNKNVFKADNAQELQCFVHYVTDPLIQEFIKGKEYTVDVFSDFDGNVITVVPRERIDVVGGESYKGKTIEDGRMVQRAKAIAESLGTTGHITLQCIEAADGVKFIEANPRFGGGAMLGITAGANTPLLLLELVLGKKLEPQIGKYKKNLLMLRHTADMFMTDNQVVKSNGTGTCF
jgi:carbamoyl-phosphate synthase large subunit